MNVIAPNYGRKDQGKVHAVAADGLTVCRKPVGDDWRETEDEATCSTCNGTAGGWRKIRPKRRA